MPDDVYVNPDRTPYKGKYKWVPDTIPSAKETAALGWLSSTVERGSFRNDYYINTSVSTNYTIIPSFNSSGTGTTYFGNPEWPINYAFRKRRNLQYFWNLFQIRHSLFTVKIFGGKHSFLQ